MPLFYVTFGPGQFDSAGQSLGNKYTTVEATDANEASRKMFEQRGRKWSHIYPNAEGFHGAGVERWGLKHVPFEAVYLDEVDAPRI